MYMDCGVKAHFIVAKLTVYIYILCSTKYITLVTLFPYNKSEQMR